MLGQQDLIGVAAVIAAVFSGIATLIGALNHRTVSDINRKVDTNGDPRELGQLASDVASQLAPPQRRATDPRAGDV